MKIDILNIKTIKGDYLVEYWDEDYEGENTTSVHVTAERLAEYVEENDLNREEFINPTLYNYECDGLDERYIDPYIYLDENLNEVVKMYIEDMERAAA